MVVSSICAGQLFTEHLDIFGRPKRNFYEMMGILATVTPHESNVYPVRSPFTILNRAYYLQHQIRSSRDSHFTL